MAQIRGLETLESVLELIKNPDSFSSKLKELKDVINIYHTAIESVTKLDSVHEYTENIKTKSEQIDKTLVEAQNNATKIVQEAKQEADKIKHRYKKKEEDLITAEATLKTRDTALVTLKNELNNLQKELEERQKLITQKEVDLRVIEKELNERKEKLLAALG